MHKSTEYRMRASELAAGAATEQDDTKRGRALSDAHYWIEMAENEDWLHSHTLTARET